MSKWPNEYPNAPGFKASGPSEQAASRIAPTAKVIRAKVLQRYIEIYPQGMTADEAAAELNLSILSVRPRVAELHRDGSLIDTGSRRRNPSGMTATVWRYAPEPAATKEAA